MPIVLDSSIAMALVMDDEDLPGADAFLDRLARERAIAPAHWELEVANALISAARRGRMPFDQCRARFDLARLFPIELELRDGDGALERTIDVSLALSLTVYDAAYLELAMRLSLPLATLDGPLAKAARAEGIEVIGTDF
jgi:predicted nucleic acid-binding protein